MNKRYKVLLDSEFRKLLFAFEESKMIFEKNGVRNNLLHPGEYGAYRERACKDFLRFILPDKFKVGDGFILNSKSEETTQCDLIIYVSDETPIIKTDEYTRFFPCESSLAIGEIKSSLSKNALLACLKKLSENKKIRKIGHSSYNPNNGYNNLFTFLICESIENFNLNLVNDIENFYKSENISVQYQHNFIISLKNGYISYEADKENKNLLKLLKVLSMDENNLMAIPSLDNIPFKHHLTIDTNSHCYYFATTLTNFLKNSTTYYPDPLFYLF